MSASNETRRPVRVIWLCVALSAAGCGRKQTAPVIESAENSPVSPGAKPGELPLEQQTDQKLDPLTKTDVDLYLNVMRAAARRVKYPTAPDQAALTDAKRILAGRASGRVPTPEDAKALERANQVAMGMDQIIAEEAKLDEKRYRGIAEAVEVVVPNPLNKSGTADRGGAKPDRGPVTASPPKWGERVSLEKRLNDVNVLNAKFLEPYREEIQSLLSVVRNPANLPPP